MTPSTLTLILNVLTLLLGGGALAAVLRYRSNMFELHSKDEANIRDHYAKEVAALREELKTCEEECATKLRTAEEKIDKAEVKIKKLDEELWGEKRQRVAEQISLINIIVASVDAPELKAILKTLESVQLAQRNYQPFAEGSMA